MPVTAYHPHVARAGRIFQIVWRMWSLSHCTDTITLQDGKAKRIPSDYGREAVRIARYIARFHKSVGIITHKALAPAFIEEFGEENVQWFGNIRGTNMLESREALFIFGQQVPHSRDIMDLAAMLDPFRMEPFHEINEDGELKQPWHPVRVEYQLTPAGQKAAAAVHPGNVPYRTIASYEDETLREVFEQFTIAELTQAVHRNRILLHKDHVVWLFSPYPLLDTAVDWVADYPPLMPQQWLDGQFSDNPIPFEAWLKIDEASSQWQEDGLTYKIMAEITGMSESYIRNEKWIDRLLKAYPDIFEAVVIRRKRGQPAHGLKRKAD